MGILGISSNIIFEIIHIYYPSVGDHQYETVLIVTIIVISIFYLLLFVGKHAFFEMILVIYVTIMAFSFLVSLFIVYPFASISVLFPFIASTYQPKNNLYQWCR